MAVMPDVAAVTRALFGDLVDPDALVAKMDPGPSDVHVSGAANRAILIPRKVRPGRQVSERTRFGGGRNSERVRFGKDNRLGRHLLEGTGIAATGVGAVLGARELKESIPAARGLWKTKQGWVTAAKPGKAMASIPRPGPAARTAGVVGMLGGDAIATGEQLHSARKPRQPVEKALPPIGDMVGGILHNSRVMNAVHAPDLVARTKQFGEAAKPVAERKAFQHAGRAKATKPLVQSYGGAEGANERLNWLRENQTARRATAAKPAAQPKRTPVDRGIAAGQAARADIGRMASTTSGKVVIGAGGLMAARGALHARNGRGAPPPDPYAYYGKRDEVTFTGEFSKFDDARRLAFGWANVSKINGLPVVDRQDDYVSIEDIEDAAYTYVEGSRVGGHMHRRVGGKAAGTLDRPHHVSNMVESMVFDDAKCDALGLDEDFPRGWWVGFRVFDDNVWDKARNGELTGFSIHGKGIRKSVDYDSIMAGPS